MKAAPGREEGEDEEGLKCAGGQRGCAVDTGHRWHESILYTKVNYGEHRGGVKSQNHRVTSWWLALEILQSSLLRNYNIPLLYKGRLSENIVLTAIFLN